MGTVDIFVSDDNFGLGDGLHVERAKESSCRTYNGSFPGGD
jgi:hypothetical protein